MKAAHTEVRVTSLAAAALVLGAALSALGCGAGERTQDAPPRATAPRAPDAQEPPAPQPTAPPEESGPASVAWGPPVSVVIHGGARASLVAGTELGAAFVVDPASGGARRVYEGHGEPLLWAALAPDGASVLLEPQSYGVGGVFARAPLAPVSAAPAPATDAEELEIFAHNSVRAAAVTADLSFGPAISTDGAVRVRGAGGALGEAWPARFPTPYPSLVRASADGRLFLAAGGEDVWLFQTSPLERRAILPGQTGPLLDAAFGPPAAGLLAIASERGAARLFRASDGTATATLPHPAAVTSVAFSPDGALLATGCDDGLARLFRTRDGSEVASFAHPAPVGAVCFSGDGAVLATGADDGAVRTWAVARPAALHTVRLPARGSESQ